MRYNSIGLFAGVRDVLEDWVTPQKSKLLTNLVIKISHIMGELEQIYVEKRPKIVPGLNFRKKYPK